MEYPNDIAPIVLLFHDLAHVVLCSVLFCSVVMRNVFVELLPECLEAIIGCLKPTRRYRQDCAHLLSLWHQISLSLSLFVSLSLSQIPRPR